MLELVPIEKDALPKAIDRNINPATPPPKAILKKFDGLGTLGFQISAVADGAYVTIVDDAKEVSRIAYAGAMDKTARLLNAPTGNLRPAFEVRDDQRAILVTEVSADLERATVFEIEPATGKSTKRFEGDNREFRFGPPGYLVEQDGSTLRLIATDGGAGKIVAAIEHASLHDRSHVAALDGRVQLVFSTKPYEVLAYGVFGDELRRIGGVTQRFFTRFERADGRVFVRVSVRASTFLELRGLEDVLSAKPVPAPAPRALEFRYFDYRIDAGAPPGVATRPELRHERSTLMPCLDGSWVTLVKYPPRRWDLVVIDAQGAIRQIKLPAGSYSQFEICVDEAGTRALMRVGKKHFVLVDLATLVARKLGSAADAALPADFGPDGQLVVGGTRLVRIADDGTLIEVGRATLAGVHSFATAVGGKVIVADRGSAIAVLGIYGDAIRPLAEVDRPEGIYFSWHRVGTHLVAHGEDTNELVGLPEVWARGRAQITA